MFLHSSKSIKSKILQAAIEVDQDYRRYREVERNKRNRESDVILSISNMNGKDK